MIASRGQSLFRIFHKGVLLPDVFPDFFPDVWPDVFPDVWPDVWPACPPALRGLLLSRFFRAPPCASLNVHVRVLFPFRD